MNSIIANVTPRALEEAEVDLIVIGNGSHKMLDGYRSEFYQRQDSLDRNTRLTLHQTNHSNSLSGCTPTPHSNSTAHSA